MFTTSVARSLLHALLFLARCGCRCPPTKSKTQSGLKPAAPRAGQNGPQNKSNQWKIQRLRCGYVGVIEGGYEQH